MKTTKSLNIKPLIPYFVAIPLVILTIVMSLIRYKNWTAEVADEAQGETQELTEVTSMDVSELAEEFGDVGFDNNIEDSETGDDAEMLTGGFEEAEEVTMINPSWHFYNADLQDNGDSKDDYNFGPNPLISEAFSEKVMEAIRAKNYTGTINIDELLKDVDASTLDAEYRARLRVDPTLGAATMAWFDSIVGTDYLGKFYSEAKEQWDAAMNDAAAQWISDSDLYSRTLDAFEKYLDHSTKVEIKRATNLTDQMYMNPFSVDGEVPRIIVMESANHSGWFLTYTFTIKETAVKEVSLRADCGFQPTNVAKVMKVKAKSNPTITGGGSGGGGTISGGGGKTTITGGGTTGTTINGGGTNPWPWWPIPTSTPTPTPTPKPTDKPKDPTKGSDVLPNDDTGPGENTNTGKGGQYSSKDEVGNSNDLTPGEYKEEISEMENNPGREGGSSSEPSTPAPSEDTKVDNNGKEADRPTEKSESSVSNDESGEAWDGPPD